MNNPRAATIFFAIIDLVLIAVFGFMYLSRDRVPPVIQFQPATITYMETTTNDELLDGARAVDSRDGDVSDRVVIEKVVLNKTTQNAVVYYAVSDHDGNVGKSSRTFPAAPALFLQNSALEAHEEVTEGANNTGVMMTQGAGDRTQPVSAEQEETEETETPAAQQAGPLVRNTGGAQDREIIGALDGADRTEDAEGQH